ncbi:MAG: aspartyl protease family protein [Candidatus Eisenbacteria bacterium]|nr:aspartyl protease family protein [Candidatus Eisenbacteria bacterium]
MRRVWIGWACLALAAVALRPVFAVAASGAIPADSLFRAGDFARAEEAYRAEYERDGDDGGSALLRLGEIALLENRLDEAESRLRAATDLLPEEKRPKLLLAETHYRRDRFTAAAPLLRAAGRTAFADQMESFEGEAPYEIAGTADSAVLPFLEGFPLPVVTIRVNGRTGRFLIDTGGSVLSLDPAFAASAGAGRSFGAEEGVFAGGRRAMYEYGRADSIGLGGFTVKNVPIHLKGIRFPPGPGGSIDGVIGTVVLYHFLSTIDYPGERLVLRRRAESASAPPGGHEIPFRMAGDHFMVARGTANGAGPCLFLVDTGLAGGGFVPADFLIDEAGIELSEETMTGIGGGGPVEIRSFTLDELSLGGARREGIRGLHGGFPGPPDRWGFLLAGIISHDYFNAWAMTFDFDRMRIVLTAPKGDSRATGAAHALR